MKSILKMRILFGFLTAARGELPYGDCRESLSFFVAPQIGHSNRQFSLFQTQKCPSFLQISAPFSIAIFPPKKIGCGESPATQFTFFSSSTFP